MTTVSTHTDPRPVAAATAAPPTWAYWAMIAVLAGLFVFMFQNVLYWAYGINLDAGWRMRGYAWTDGDWSHALIVPAISLYFLYQHRAALKQATIRRSWLGFVVMMAGVAAYFLSIFPIRNATVEGYSMLLTLFGLVWFLCGWSVIRVAWFSIAFLIFAIKISDGAWSAIAFKLQYIAAQMGGMMVTVFGMPMELEAFVRGNVIELERGGRFIGDLNVAEACSGLRMLTTFIALGVAVAYLVSRPWWSRLALVLLTVPIAIFVNVIRVAILGFLFPWYPNLATGDFHVMIGMFMLVPALGLFIGVGWLLDHLAAAPAAAPAEAAAPASPTTRPAAQTAPDEARDARHD